MLFCSARRTALALVNASLLSLPVVLPHPFTALPPLVGAAVSALSSPLLSPPSPSTATPWCCPHPTPPLPSRAHHECFRVASTSLPGVRERQRLCCFSPLFPFLPLVSRLPPFLAAWERCGAGALFAPPPRTPQKKENRTRRSLYGRRTHTHTQTLTHVDRQSLPLGPINAHACARIGTDKAQAHTYLHTRTLPLPPMIAMLCCATIFFFSCVCVCLCVPSSLVVLTPARPFREECLVPVVCTSASFLSPPVSHRFWHSVAGALGCFACFCVRVGVGEGGGWLSPSHKLALYSPLHPPPPSLPPFGVLCFLPPCAPFFLLRCVLCCL